MQQKQQTKTPKQEHIDAQIRLALVNSVPNCRNRLILCPRLQTAWAALQEAHANVQRA